MPPSPAPPPQLEEKETSQTSLPFPSPSPSKARPHLPPKYTTHTGYLILKSIYTTIHPATPYFLLLAANHLATTIDQQARLVLEQEPTPTSPSPSPVPLYASIMGFTCVAGTHYAMHLNSEQRHYQDVILVGSVLLGLYFGVRDGFEFHEMLLCLLPLSMTISMGLVTIIRVLGSFFEVVMNIRRDFRSRVRE
ncbi:hypothetical protein B0H63DRAFT_522780 [Podospora didyma]|uniref:Uncharacterized protein n=1 Tax=Podospora didyma TaxID=330526 RepID=A0AAE0TZN3_9PEZI|nr:hypothetical protein B0H63DRAFT_522780 [Podospora didyma]